MNRIEARRHLQFKPDVETRPEEKDPEEFGKLIKKKRLINILNRVNFQNGIILANFRHPKYNKIIALPLKPLPCINDNLECAWLKPDDFDRKFKSYDFLNFQISNGLSHILVEAELQQMNEYGVRFSLPQICYEVSTREVKRYECSGIYVQISQSGFVLYGMLSGFSAVSLAIDLSFVPHSLMRELNFSSPVDIVLKNEQEVIYSGPCEIVRHVDNEQVRSLVVRPLVKQLQRFSPKKYRSIRQKLSPSPNIIFTHPIINKIVNLKIINISGAGLLVEEKYDNSVLLPGMIISEVCIEFANNFCMKAKVQVLYYIEEENKCVKCGLGILDMEIRDQVRLSSLLHQAMDTNSYVCAKVDSDALWNFFFDTGFVYPEKYAMIHVQKNKFKELYERLYTHNPNIAINFIYQDKGVICGHLAMFRFYENTWIIHHHAAVKSNNNKAGIAVLEQVARHINEFHRLPSSHMNYVACYFRPENRFPSHVFGALAKQSNDPKGCALDSFAYFYYQKPSDRDKIPEPWTLVESQQNDLHELKDFYEHESGGLMLHALDLAPEIHHTYGELNEKYHELGLKRERLLFSLKKSGELKAVVMITLSDIGLNLSELTNCIHVFVLDIEGLRRDIFFSLLSYMSEYYDEHDIPVLLYPVAYTDSQAIAYEKIYDFWVLNTYSYGDNYFKYLDKLFYRARNKKLSSSLS